MGTQKRCVAAQTMIRKSKILKIANVFNIYHNLFILLIIIIIILIDYIFCKLILIIRQLDELTTKYKIIK